MFWILVLFFILIEIIRKENFMKKNAEETFNLRSKLKMIAYLTMNILLTHMIVELLVIFVSVTIHSNKSSCYKKDINRAFRHYRKKPGGN